MSEPQTCPVCLGKYTRVAARIGQGFGSGVYTVSCSACGDYEVTREAWDDYLDPAGTVGARLNPPYRALISHKLRTGISHRHDERPHLNSELMEKFTTDGVESLTPHQQAKNAIRFVGEHVMRAGGILPELSEGFYAIIGSPNPNMAGNLAAELHRRGLIEGYVRQSVNLPVDILNANLTLDGWEQYEAEKRGEYSGKTAFIALRFNDPLLDALLRDVIKPCLKEDLGFDLVDMRDVSQAGIIDNIMRAQIRDAAFVLVELTHDNPGAYWEAGYAEGLGKPVIYLCEKLKFDASRTHFDTNHCTTVSWLAEEPDQFRRNLVATIRRSLNLFA